MHPRLLRPVLAVALLLTLPGAAYADPTGLHLVADNAATAGTAASVAPLNAAPVQDLAGGKLGGHSVSLPAGFSLSVIAAGLTAPRFMAFDQDGNLLVANAGAGTIVRYPAAGGSMAPSAEPPTPLVSGLDAPSNVALHDGFLYIGETSAISRYAYAPEGGVGGREVVVPNLPRGGHSTRTVAFAPDGGMFVSVGSSCNICNESDSRRASILRFEADGANGERFASGLRNAVGLAIQPATGLLWATVNERDDQGNEIPTDLVTAVAGGENFGWPACQPPNATPQDGGGDCSDVSPPSVGIQAHSAPLGLAFYGGTQFPADYQNDLLLAQHGSWNRTPPAAPKLLRIHFEGDTPVSAMDLATGWQGADGNRWGRPAGVAVAPDGSVIVSDDDAGVLYRLSYAAS